MSRVLKAVVACGIATLFALVGAEIFLRYVYPLGGAIYQLDKHRFQEHRPNSSKIYVHLEANGGQRVRVDINSYGFRGPEFSREHPGTRIILYGDSFTVAEYTVWENTFGEVLEEELGQQYPDVEVLNAGVVGYGPDQVSLRIREDLEQLNPEIVILLVFSGNDFGDLIRNKIYRLDDDAQLLRTGAVPSQELMDEFSLDGLSRSAFFRLIKRAMRSVPRRLQNLELNAEGNAVASEDDSFYKRLTRIMQYEYEQYLKSPLVTTNLFNDGFDADIALLPDSASSRHKLTLMNAVLNEIEATVRKQGTTLYVVSIPSVRALVGTYDGDTIDQTVWPQYSPTRLSEAVCQNFTADRCLDAFDLFKRNDPENLYYRAGNNHWNEKGQVLLARHVAQWVAKSNTSGMPGER